MRLEFNDCVRTVTRRYENLEKELRRALEEAESRGEQVPDLSKRSRCITPIAEFDEGGELKWNDALVKDIKALTQKTKPRAAGGR